MSNDITATYSTGTNTTATINSNSTGPNNVSVTSPSVSQLQSNVNQAYNQIPSLAGTLLNVATSGLNSYTSIASLA